MIEHTFSMSAILEHARGNGLLVAITFVDLRNAFGSIAHGLIHDTLEILKVPTQVRKYIRDLYAQLKATIRTKQWSSPEFSVKRGVFQGDTLSPIIFLLTFNPIIRLTDAIQSGGFCFKSPILNSSDLPDPSSNIYVNGTKKIPTMNPVGTTVQFKNTILTARQPSSIKMIARRESQN